MAHTLPYMAPAIRIKTDAAKSMAAARQHLKDLPNQYGNPATDYLGDFDYGAAISGVLGLAGQYANTVNQDLNLGMVPGTVLSPTGEPVYNLGGFYNQVSGATPQDATTGEVLGAVGQGAASGFVAGGPIGAAVGGVVGLGTSLIGGRRRRNKQQKEKDKALAGVQTKQRDFNQASQSFEERQLAFQDYQDRSNINDRLYNLYK